MSTISGVRVVRAAGGVVSREGVQGPEVVLVHRSRYDDWSLPKGKLSPGEHPLAAAVREVEEETGVRGVPRLRLPSTRYLTGSPGVEKVVEYWAMRCAGLREFTPNDEVDEIRWVPVAQAGPLLTYAHDRGVLNAFAQVPPVTGVVVLLRHAYAGERGEGSGPDRERPLRDGGPATALRLAQLLTLFDPDRIVSASPVRCVQTVEPLAAAVSKPLHTDVRFDEAADPVVAAAQVRTLAAGGHTAVVCSQGKLIPKVMRLLANRNVDGFETPKGGSWVLAFAGSDLIGKAFLDPPG